MKALHNKTAIVTGASSGIGRAAAKLFAEEGAAVVVGARRQPELDQLVDEITAAGGRAMALAGDIRSEDYIRDLVELAVQRFGKLDVAFNNAGVLGSATSAPDLSREEWTDVIDTNLTSSFLCAKYQLPRLLETEGSLVFTASFVGNTVGMPQTPAYSASKAGIVGLTKALSSEYGPRGVRVNALLPGGVDTAMAVEFSDEPEVVASVKRLHALKRLAAPEEIARAALYLASSQSSFVTGTAMLVDGGVSIART